MGGKAKAAAVRYSGQNHVHVGSSWRHREVADAQRALGAHEGVEGFNVQAPVGFRLTGMRE